jgi:predicted TIM-barrel fold metal-dependent hydrolase
MEAGRIGLAVHLHTGFGAGSYFGISGSNPVLLESVLNEKALRKTTFVLVHGGWPFTKEVAALFARPNVYADFSAQAFFLSPVELSDVLRNWLAMFPEKILFGTDTFATTFEIGWEEIGWLTATTGREALALALTKMLAEGQLSRTQALEFARSVLRDNAIRLYGFKNIQGTNGQE